MTEKEKCLPHEKLLSILRYDPETGDFFWKGSKGWCSKGWKAGSINALGYRMITIDQKLYAAHRLAWFYMHQEWPRPIIDHINRVRNDNRIVNLRVVTQRENSKNVDESRKGPFPRKKEGPNTNSKSGIRGVSFHVGKWRASIYREGKVVCLGRFATIEEAKEAYDKADR